MKQLAQLLTHKKLSIAVAESCTGGNLSALLTSESGASAYFDRGFITYSNQAKIELLGVKKSTLNTFGAVSEQTALEMAQGVIKNSSANIGISITGIAGPLGGTKNKPVGTVCFGFCVLGKYQTNTQCFSGDRASVVKQSVAFVVDNLVKQLSNNKL